MSCISVRPVAASSTRISSLYKRTAIQRPSAETTVAPALVLLLLDVFTSPALASKSHRRQALERSINEPSTVTARLTPKERLEIFANGGILQLDNFRRLTGFGWPGFRSMKMWRQDKGQVACARTFVGAVKQGQPAPIPLDEILEVSRVSIELQNALRA